MDARLVLLVLLVVLAGCAPPNPYEVARHYCEGQGISPGTMAYWNCEGPAVARERARQDAVSQQADEPRPQPAAVLWTPPPYQTYPMAAPPPPPQGMPTDVGTPYYVSAPPRTGCIGVVPVPVHVATPCP